MTKHTLNSSIVYLQAKVYEQLGLLADAMKRPSEAGDMERLANMALNLATLEGALITLQQHAPNLVELINKPPEEDSEEETSPEQPEEPPASPKVVTAEMSPTFKKSQKRHKRGKSES
jgi:hypothetical protein